MDPRSGRDALTAAQFDPEAIMAAVRATVSANPVATTATLRQTPRANVAKSQLSQGTTRPKPANCRNVAIVAAGDAPKCADGEAAVDERAGLAADRVPAVYLDVWARLNCQKPFDVTEAEWRLAIDDGGRFLDAWGSEAAVLGLSPGDLFDVRAGIVWRLAGGRVEALVVDGDGVDHVRLNDGRIIKRPSLGNRKAGGG